MTTTRRRTRPRTAWGWFGHVVGLAIVIGGLVLVLSAILAGVVLAWRAIVG